MIDALLDPFILSVPDDPSSEEAQSFMDRLLRWSRSANEAGFRLLVSEKYIRRMYEKGQIPSFTRLKSLCSGQDPHLYDAETVNSVFAKILNQHLEDRMSVKDVLLDDEYTKVEPVHISSRLDSSVDQALTEALAIYALNRKISLVSAPNFIITDSVKSDALSGTFKIEHADLPENSSVTFPSLINHEWAVVDDAERLLASMDGECKNLSEAVTKAEEEFEDDLVFLKSAHDSAGTYQQYQLPQKGYHALKVLGEVCRLYRRNELGNQDISAAIKERLGPRSFAPDVSQSAKTRPRRDYEVTYKGEKRQLGPHIMLGGAKKNARNHLRIYFLIDEESKFVVGHVGAHLD